MSTTLEQHVEWTTPAPLWRFKQDPSAAANRLAFRTPAILRFARDSFMEDFLNLLSTDPGRLNEYVATPETWSSPPNEPIAAKPISGLSLTLFRAREAAVKRLQAGGVNVIGKSLGAPATKKLKLFQPAHGRFYLVTTCLVCRSVGLPDRRIEAGAEERTSFVVRLLQPRASAVPIEPDPRDCDEFALVGGAWQPLANPEILAGGEEKKPLAPATYLEDDGRQRRLLVGLVPIGEREKFLQAAQPAPGFPSVPPVVIDSRQMLLKTRVIGPIKNLQDVADFALKTSTVVLKDSTDFPTPVQIQAVVDRANLQIQEVSWYILLDLANFFEEWIPDFWQAILANPTAPVLAGAQQTLWDTLSGTSFSGITLAAAMLQAHSAARQLEAVTSKYVKGSSDWPAFLFPFYTAAATGTTGLTPDLVRDTLEAQIVAALPSVPASPVPPARVVAQASANPQAPAWFTMRCVLERPNCGVLSPPTISEPTAAFQMAGYFDPDAPTRPIRIGLPIDTTPAGLRKFDRNTAFVMSDTLCGQVGKFNSMSFGDLIMSVLPFPLHQDLDPGGDAPCSSGGFSAGMICSFSIPIITICALIVLILIVKLLDIVFFWMPFFQICLPLPKFSAKAST